MFSYNFNITAYLLLFPVQILWYQLSSLLPLLSNPLLSSPSWITRGYHWKSSVEKGLIWLLQSLNAVLWILSPWVNLYLLVYPVFLPAFFTSLSKFILIISDIIAIAPKRIHEFPFFLFCCVFQAFAICNY